METATMFRSCILLIALSMPAAALQAQTAPASKPNPNPAPPMKMQAPPGMPGAAAAPGTPEEPARKSPFDEMDTNHDGFVSRDEFLAYQKKRFDEFDTNHDGKTDAKEIASSPPLMERNLKTAERMVKQWDKNGDGVITADEFKQDAEDRFSRQDKEGKGKIARPTPPAMPAKGQLMPPNGKPPMQPPSQPQPKKP
jgi:hypothetical protein